MVKVLRSIVRGPLEPYVAGFAEELLRQGYTRSSAEQHVCFIAHLDRWMLAEGVGLDGLSGSVIERYLAAAARGRVCGVPVAARRCDRCWTTSRRWVCCRSRQEVPPDPVEELLGRYRGYLLAERGLTPGTVARLRGLRAAVRRDPGAR